LLARRARQHPGQAGALIPQADANTAADPNAATMLANMALMRAFGMAPSAGIALEMPQQQRFELRGRLAFCPRSSPQKI
jgi:hypothetical protein